MFSIKSKLEWLATLCRHSGVGLWDAVVHNGDPAHEKSRWTWSPEMRRLCGYESENDFPNKMTSWSNLLHPDDVGPTFAAFGETLRTGVSYCVFYRLKTKNGSYRWFQATGGVVKNARGQVRRACGSLIDVHDAKTQEIEQNQAVVVLIERMHDLANGQLQGRIPDIFPVRFAELRRDYNAALDSLCSAMQIVTRTSDAIKSNAHEIQGASDDLSRRTEHQAASLEETAAAMDEITGAVREAADNARRACSIVDTARTEASESNDVVKSTIEAMTGIERTSSEISEIIGVIDGIAFQTNLLALNAGVEAARAGDAGRGFAVVASEVRALAQRSAEAAKDVKARITASSSQVERGVKLVGETGNALQRIVSRIGSISELVTVIVSTFEQQSVGLQQINTAIGEMDSVTQQNAAMVEEATASARNLASEADELSSQVMRFDTGAADALRHSGNKMPLSRAA